MTFPVTPEVLRDHVTTDLINDALQTLLNAAEDAINARAGATGDRTEFLYGGGRFLTLARQATAIGVITETYGSTVITLAADDYRIWPDGYTLERITGGTNSRWRWHGLVSVTYTPVTDESLRELVQIDLVESILNYSPGLVSERIGEWEERYANGRDWNNADEWEMILSRLDTTPGMVVIGGGGW